MNISWLLKKWRLLWELMHFIMNTCFLFETGFDHIYLDHIVTNMIIPRQRFGKHRLKARIVEPERTSIAELRFRNDVPAATNSNDRVHS
jgi:hypothetical protein